MLPQVRAKCIQSGMNDYTVFVHPRPVVRSHWCNYIDNVAYNNYSTGWSLDPVYYSRRLYVYVRPRCVIALILLFLICGDAL